MRLDDRFRDVEPQSKTSEVLLGDCALERREQRGQSILGDADASIADRQLGLRPVPAQGYFDGPALAELDGVVEKDEEHPLETSRIEPADNRGCLRDGDGAPRAPGAVGELLHTSG